MWFHAKIVARMFLSAHQPKPLLFKLALLPHLHSFTSRCYFLSQASLPCRSISSYRDPLVTFLLDALKCSSSVSCCRVIHARVIKSLNFRDGFIGDQLVSSYLNMGLIHDAEKLFDEMANKDFVSWNSLVSGFSKMGHLGRCISLFSMIKSEYGLELNELTLLSIISVCASAQARDEGQYLHCCALKLGMLAEVKVANSLINMYGKFGCVDCAFRLFQAMSEPNMISWNSVVASCTQNGIPIEAINYFNMMRMNGFFPDEATMVSLLQACEFLPLGMLIEALHSVIFTCGLDSNVTIVTTLLNLYSKLGRLDASRKVYAEISKPDKVAWSAMIAGYAIHGCGKEAIEFFERTVMAGMKPDHVTFTHLLSACSHSGLVKEGKYYFRIMSDVYGVQPRLDHYSCMVDLLGRCGLLSDARNLIMHMPLQPNSAVWGALLSACRVYGNIDLGKEAAENLIALDPYDPRNYIMLSNIYSASGLWSEASKLRTLMKRNVLTKNPGCSFIEHGNKIHRFMVDDYSHPDSDKIHKKLEELIRKIQEVGFVSETESILHDVDEEVKINMVNKHSEKIALAYGLLVTNADKPLVIIKNLRICRDCHTTVKFVSQIEKRVIIIRDSKRFHHFSDGLCSCGDYW
ncbi:pentatricopeptide repeat-containing protein At5g40410, mitochondrial isoform X1 [Arachis ipaensis]|uniref:pentatricopeptide repeat-containing protein At5g40410, mitochondrial isoform X1 n=1 Tax=Arachis ipaensis TaxID=130454 RepID=UPI0007AF1ECB|nr:pentatricopeptide repeat-containing protein At5g40410, mitochondrial isoform X1 [Arachis ipaensis]XP_016170529.1 pentatricopeptide repeat-containing protein At5g40410, mitochondrial isoform X1 [Arachis ipaensis]XP_016170531.1 pentatricopeptide repeat-containing protein At5g40410, mitochondrial isoform X1 [Arachis ipaensis]XP_025671770.1 pentatricopeptide repeat-containing protein At5g40410, mitochondrial isoform X1 [Arachis hypogaea]XP_025671771.1 pentatricopeptide repeat-containing protein 